ncbi:MAG: hypothetical protein MK116_05065 [Phycisphaerales bacterium]|nr:hypothetical protein [Phycisphaerales bacterium]
MKVRSYSTVLMTSLATSLMALASTASAGTTGMYNPAYLTSPQKTPFTSHSNQDGEEPPKSIIQVPTLIKDSTPWDFTLGDTPRDVSLIDLVIVMTPPSFDSSGTDIIEPGLIVSVENVDVDFIAAVPPPASTGSGGFSGLGSTGIPAPGAIGLLALAGLATRKRRRR